MKRIMLLMAAVAAMFSCVKAPGPGECSGDRVRVCVSLSSEPLSRSYVGGSTDEGAVRCWAVGAYLRSTGRLDSYSTGSEQSLVRIELRAGQAYDLFFLANLPDMQLPLLEQDARSMRVPLPSREGYATTGLPAMALRENFSTTAGTTISQSLTRLVSRVDFTSDVGDLRKLGMKITGVRMCQAALDVLPFQSGGGAAQSVGDGDCSLPAEVDLLNSGGTLSFYCGENCQGVPAALASNTDPWQKVPDNASEISSRATFLQVDAEFVAPRNFEGKVSYRMYLGADALGDFNLRRNNVYSLRLLLDPQRLERGINSPTWKIDVGEISAWYPFSYHWQSGGNGTFYQSGEEDVLVVDNAFLDDGEMIYFSYADAGTVSDGGNLEDDYLYVEAISPEELLVRMGDGCTDRDIFVVHNGMYMSVPVHFCRNPALAVYNQPGRDPSDLYLAQTCTFSAGGCSYGEVEWSLPFGSGVVSIEDEGENAACRIRCLSEGTATLRAVKTSTSEVVERTIVVKTPQLRVNRLIEPHLQLGADGTPVRFGVYYYSDSGVKIPDDSFDPLLYASLLAVRGGQWLDDAPRRGFVSVDYASGQFRLDRLRDASGCILEDDFSCRHRLFAGDPLSPVTWADVFVDVRNPFPDPQKDAGYVENGWYLGQTGRTAFNPGLHVDLGSSPVSSVNMLPPTLDEWDFHIGEDGTIDEVGATLDFDRERPIWLKGDFVLKFRIDNSVSGEHYDSPSYGVGIKLVGAIAQKTFFVDGHWYLVPVWYRFDDFSPNPYSNQYYAIPGNCVKWGTDKLYITSASRHTESRRLCTAQIGSTALNLSGWFLANLVDISEYSFTDGGFTSLSIGQLLLEDPVTHRNFAGGRLDIQPYTTIPMVLLDYTICL